MTRDPAAVTLLAPEAAIWRTQVRFLGAGTIAVATSVAGDRGRRSNYVYGAAKGGIWGLSNVLAIEGRKYNIRIWTLAPGALTRRQFHPNEAGELLGRPGHRSGVDP